MIFSFSNFIKTASINAVFLFSGHALAIPNSYENIKNKAAELLAQKKKDQALRLIISYSRTDRSKNYKKETGELLYLAAQTFLSKEAQEEYESSLNATLDNEKNAQKSVERCLNLEPQNLDCQIQKARLAYRSKNDRVFKATIATIRDLLANSFYEPLFGLFLEKKDADFKNRQIFSGQNESLPENMFGFVLLELDRCFAVKNFSRAKDILISLEKSFSDWPDLLYYKHRLNAESEEDPAKISSELLAAYASKCKSITKSASRKYRYDFELCIRGVKS